MRTYSLIYRNKHFQKKIFYRHLVLELNYFYFIDLGIRNYNLNIYGKRFLFLNDLVFSRDNFLYFKQES